ncbi:serine/threonine protein kinase [Labilithrix luteola]|uniref:Serine/threonine protein kinase n=1 Tax=Labilithrix luteola TaxID=1391654 RepID=A0A0K1Q6F1_9BACT|nr:serine/threonine protein kinase [Labilithrix luteola]
MRFSASEGASWLPAPGSIIAGRYRVGRVIGSGGMGAVVDAQHVQLGESVAIKFLHPDLASDADNVQRFVREAQATSRIKSEHVVRMFDVGTTESGLPYIVMELLAGHELGHLLAQGPLPVGLAVDCVLQAAEALAEAHLAGIVHRDIKPSNLWLSHRPDGSPRVKVLDFGISKLIEPSTTNTKLTQTQSVFGSPTYMSPEQIRSAKHVDQRTDVWALGVVLHELLSASLPFEGDNVAGVLAAIAADAPRRLRQARPDAPVELERVILRLLEKDPSKRMLLGELGPALRPFATNTGAISADRLARVARGLVSMLPPAPASSAGPPAASVTQRTDAPTPRNPLWRFSVLGGLAGLLLVVAFVGMAATAKKAGDETSPSASASATSSGITMPPPTISALVEPVPSAAESAAQPAPTATPQPTVSASGTARKPAPAHSRSQVVAPSAVPAHAERPPEISEDRK